MQLDAAIDAVRTVRQLASHGDALVAQADAMQSFVGAADSTLDAAWTAARDHGVDAVDTLSNAGLADAAVADVRRAVELLDTAPTTISHLRARGADLAATSRRTLRTIDQGADPSLRREIFADLVSRDTDQLVADDWRRMGDLLARDPAGNLHAGPRTLEGAPDFDDLARTAASDIGAADVPALDRYMRAFRLAGSDADTLRAQALEIAELPREELTVDHWRGLSALLDANPDGSIFVGTSSADQLATARREVRSLAMGGSPEGLHTVDHLLANIRLQAMPPERIRDRAMELFAQNPEHLTQAQWRELQSMLDVDSAGTILTGPRNLRNAEPMMTYVPGLAAGKSPKVHNVMDRYFEAWRLVDATPEQVRETAAELLARPSDALARRDWARLAAAFDMDTKGVLSSTDEVVGNRPIGKWLTDLATGELKHDHGELADWFTRMRKLLDPDHGSKVDAALEAVKAGVGTEEQARLVAGESQSLAALMQESADPLEALRVADALLDLDVVSSTRASREPLELVRFALRRVDGVPQQLDSHLRAARELASTNLQRLDGIIKNPTAPGVSRYPDYAEIGRIHSTAKLIRRRVDPDFVVPSHAAPAPSTAATSTGARTLSW